MARRLLNLLTALSLLLCVAFCALWVHGFYVLDVPVVTTWRGNPKGSVRTEWRAKSGKGVVALVLQCDVLTLFAMAHPSRVSNARAAAEWQAVRAAIEP